MTPDERIDRIEAVFTELSLKLDRLLYSQEQLIKAFTRVNTSGEKVNEISNLNSNLNGLHEKVILGKTYKTVFSKRINDFTNYSFRYD